MTERAERQPTNYELVYMDPPPAPGAGNGGKLYTVLDKLAADDSGAWAQIAECKSRSGANSILTSIKTGKRRTPRAWNQYEFTARTDSATNTSRLFAKFVGEAGAAAAEEAAKDKPARKRRAAASE